MSRNFCFLLLILVYSSEVSSNEGEFAYLIFKAQVSDKPKQPTFIALFLKHKDIHIKANDAYSKVKRGTYTFNHIDFGASIESGHKTKYFRRPIKFNLEKNRVYLIGYLEFSGKSNRKYKMRTDRNMELLIEACRALPSHAKTLPFANALTGEEFSWTCENVPKKNA